MNEQLGLASNDELKSGGGDELSVHLYYNGTSHYNVFIPDMPPSAAETLKAAPEFARDPVSFAGMSE